MSAVLQPTDLSLDPAQAALDALSRAGLRAAEDAKRANTHMVVAEMAKLCMSARRNICACGLSKVRCNTQTTVPERLGIMRPNHNAILCRSATAEELAFLSGPGSSF